MLLLVVHCRLQRWLSFNLVLLQRATFISTMRNLCVI